MTTELCDLTRYRYALFDMDGTLVDSMAYWKQLPEDYLAAHGVVLDDAGREAIARSRGYGEILGYFASRGVTADLPSLFAFVTTKMAYYYENKVKAKPGTRELLDALKEAGCRMGILTMTPHADVNICLGKTGLAPYFEFVLTMEDTEDKSGKEGTRIFEMALDCFGGAKPAECLFFEDSLYSIRTAREMGFPIVGVSDPWAKFEETEIRALSDLYLDLG